MSALDGWIDVCRTGTWRDASNKEVEVTEQMLDGLVAAHASQDPVPVVVGHPAMDAPAYAHVEAVRRQGDRLQAKFRDILPAFRQAVEAGSYTGRSIAMKGGALRHVGFLGGRPPAVPGLAPTQFGAKADQEIRLAAAELGSEDTRYAFHAMARIARGMRERIIASDGIEAADETIPSWEIDALQRAADEAADATYAQPPTKDSTMEDDKPDEATLAAKAAELKAREDRLAEREAAAARTAGLSSADAALEAHVKAGRILPAERPALAALLASLPDDGTITFAAPEGTGEVQEKPREVLDRLFAALPVRVRYDELAGGQVPAIPGAAEDSAAIAAEARTLMSEASARGETLTALDAVDRVRAKRGMRS